MRSASWKQRSRSGFTFVGNPCAATAWLASCESPAAPDAAEPPPPCVCVCVGPCVPPKKLWFVAADGPANRRDVASNGLRPMSFSVLPARALQADHADLGALVLECTNMVPYAADIRAATGLPVFSIESFVTWFQSGLSPRAFADPR